RGRRDHRPQLHPGHPARRLRDGRARRRARRGGGAGMLTVVCWKWRRPVTYRSQYAPETVHTLRRMVAAHYAKPHRFVCVTDDPTGLDGIETIPIWQDG